MQVYHKIDEYYGVVDNGVTVFSGSKEACVEYVNLFTNKKADVFQDMFGEPCPKFPQV